jgi:adenylate cyclase
MKRLFHFPIILKLVILSTVMLGVVTLVVSYKSSELFETISTDREEATNLNIADSSSIEVDNLIQSYIDKINFYGLEELKTSSKNTENVAFNNDPEFYGIIIKPAKTGSEDLKSIRLINSKNTIKNIDIGSYLFKLSESLSEKNIFTFDGKIQIYNLSSKETMGVLAIGIPLIKNEQGQITSIAWGFIKIDRIQRSFSNKSDRVIYLVDKDGKILAHPNETNVLNIKDMSKSPIVKDAMTSAIRVKQKYFTNLKTDEKFLGAFAKTSTDLIIVSEVPMSIINAPSELVKKNSYFILGLALSISFFLTFLFSQSLTSPIEKLLGLTKEIAKGNFEVTAKNIVKSHDEVGELAIAFDDMTEGLKERDKMKNLFDKFHGTAITEELLKNEISLGGKRKEVTVFFSDIRGFTDFSEGHTPEEVVSMLNEYFEIMVHIINKNGGVVDKFIGDAIMAIWGVPHQTEADTVNAVKACLEMRIALKKLNESRQSRQLSTIKIGMGLHSGEAISGQIGSSERMEFTVIGDTINTASRVEGATKAFGVDLLLTQNVIDKMGPKMSKYFITSVAGDVKVQGKVEPIKLHRVNGYMENGVAKIIKTPYSDFDMSDDTKSKIVA